MGADVTVADCDPLRSEPLRSVTPTVHTQTADRIITLGMPVPECKPGALAYAAADAADAMRWAHQHIHHHNVKTAVLIAHDWQDANPDDVADLQAGLQHLQRSARVDQNTLEIRAEPMALAFAANFKRLSHWATDVESPMRGEPAFIVGAGSSLDRNVHLMAEAATKGYVFAVNTSAGPVRDTCDLVVCSESKDVTAGLALGPETLHVLEMTASPLNWDHPAQNRLAFTSLDPPTVDHVLRMGGIPIPYTGTCAAGAYALARYWGADPIVLVGTDMAFLDGRVYAQGTCFDDIRCEQHENVMTFTGQSKQIPDTEVVLAPGWGDGGLVTTAPTFVDFMRQWSRFAADATIINASEAGLRIPHTHEYTLRATLDMMETIDKRPIEMPKSVSGEWESARVKRLLAEVVASDDPHWPMHRVPMLAMMAIPEVMRMNKLGTLNPAQRRERLHAHVKRSAERLLEAM